MFETFMSSKTATIAVAIVAFLFAALLVVIIVRMLFGGKLRMPGGRARQARLGIVDAFDLDRQRQLIIVRRDNTEHLIMIGGPNDVLIESEIVRVEARDRREKSDPFGAAQTDARILAPFTPVTDRPEAKPDQLRPPALEPVSAAPAPDFSPPALPVELLPPVAQAEPIVRTPTFPLPPRRPATPPRLPESVSRADDPPLSGPSPAPVEIPPVTITPQPPANLQIEANPPPPSIAPAPALPQPSAPARTPPPFLKPLPPRPPIRPLQRTTPQAPPATPSAPAADAPAPVAPPKPRPPLSTNAPKPPAPKPAQLPPPPPPPDSQDALESLEEEMAKLLGRGPS